MFMKVVIFETLKLIERLAQAPQLASSFIDWHSLRVQQAAAKEVEYIVLIDGYSRKFTCRSSVRTQDSPC